MFRGQMYIFLNIIYLNIAAVFKKISLKISLTDSS